MICCNYAVIDEYQFFLTVVAEKKTAAKRVLGPLAPRVQQAYQTYLNNFPALCVQADSLFHADPAHARTKLQKCYSSATKSFKKFKSDYSGRQHRAIQELCPYCMLETGWTLDHYVGQTAFPEYAILTKNLLPCCFKCNQQKNENWREHGQRKYINFYDDTFLQYRFLDAQLLIRANVPVLQYRLIQPATISDDEFALIERHFDALELIPKYNKKANNRLSTELDVLRKGARRGKTNVELQEDLMDRYESHVVQYGVNYWQTLIYLALARNIANVRPLL